MVGEAFTKRAGLSIMLGTVRYYHGTLKSNDLVFFVTLRYSRYWKNPFAYTSCQWEIKYQKRTTYGNRKEMPLSRS